MKELNNLGLVKPEDAMKYTASSVSNDTSNRGFLDNVFYNASQFGQQLLNTGGYLFSADPNTLLTDSNASTYLSQNSNLNDNERNQIKNMISSDDKTVYNVTIGEIKANDFDTIVSSIKNAQTNTN
jgi:hypothetical protein